MKSTAHYKAEKATDQAPNRNNDISVIMPAYNVADKIMETLSKLVRVLNQITKDFEIIVVNDGSSDETESIVRSYLMNNPRVKLVSYSHNMGKGYALKKGFVRANNNIVIFLDSDLDIGPEHIKSYRRALGRCDIVIASKRHMRSDYRAPTIRKILSTSFNIIVKLLLGIEYSDTQAGLKAFNKRSLEKVMRMGLVKGYAFDVELLSLASLLNLKVLEAPVKAHLSSRFSLRSIVLMLIDLAGLFYRLKVIKWYQKNLNRRSVKYEPILPI